MHPHVQSCLHNTDHTIELYAMLNSRATCHCLTRMMEQPQRTMTRPMTELLCHPHPQPTRTATPCSSTFTGMVLWDTWFVAQHWYNSTTTAISKRTYPAPSSRHVHHTHNPVSTFAHPRPGYQCASLSTALHLYLAWVARPSCKHGSRQRCF